MSADLLNDIFRRADKNDDGVLSLEEFGAMFNDNDFTDEQIQALFEKVDTDKSGTIETTELAAFFHNNMGDMKGSFDSLDALNMSLAGFLQHAHNAAQSDDEEAKAIAAFFIRQLGHQLEHITDALEQSHATLRPNTKEVVPQPQRKPRQQSTANIVSEFENRFAALARNVSDHITAPLTSINEELADVKQRISSKPAAQKATLPIILSLAALGVAVYALRK